MNGVPGAAGLFSEEGNLLARLHRSFEHSSARHPPVRMRAGHHLGQLDSKTSISAASLDGAEQLGSFAEQWPRRGSPSSGVELAVTDRYQQIIKRVGAVRGRSQ